MLNNKIDTLKFDRYDIGIVSSKIHKHYDEALEQSNVGVYNTIIYYYCCRWKRIKFMKD